MKAIILAAGRGSRMKTLTDEHPKCLVELHGKPLLVWQLESLRGAGLQEIGIVTGYKRELLANRGLHEFHNPRWAQTNMVSSLACAREWLEAGPCIVSYSDIFYPSQAVTSLIECSADLAVTYDPNWLKLWESRFGDPLSDAETFRMSPEGYLVEIGNQPKSVQEVEGQYMGLLRFTPSGWSETIRIFSGLMPPERDKIHMTGTLQKVVDVRGVKIKCVPLAGKWGEIDSDTDLDFYRKQH
jgi:choline kinase